MRSGDSAAQRNGRIANARLIVPVTLPKAARLSHRGDSYIHIRINRNFFIAAISSLLVHALLLFFLSRQELLNQHLPIEAQPQTIDVWLTPRMSSKVEAAPPAAIYQPPLASPLRQELKPTVKPPPVSRPNTPREIAAVQTEPAPAQLPAPTAQRAPAPPKPAVPDPAQFTDMMAYVNAARERRHLAGEDADRINEEAAARERGPSEDETRMANLRRSLQPSGTNGIFQILSMDASTATFAFRGWKNEFSYSHREVYQVDAGRDGDVARAVVRKMIEIIRRYYTGDFNWESPRLGRVVVLSASLQDNDGLEDFLLQEFFGSRGISAR